MEPAEVVLRFLESVGRREESQFYLNLFRAEPKERFAAISVDANVARHATEAVVLDLRFLHALGLVPLVALGLFEPTDAPEHGARIRRRLERAGVPSKLIDLGAAPDPTVLAAEITDATHTGALPIAIFPSGGKTEPEVDARFLHLGAILSSLRTRKLIFLHRPGGLRQKGGLVPVVNLTVDYGELRASRELSRKEQAILVQSRRLVERAAHKLLVAVTSPFNLFRELFTTKGAGTLLRRGAVIARHDGLGAVDRERLRGLLQASFGRPPRDEFFSRPIARIYLEEGYRGAAVVVESELGAYLSKFAVEPEAQGEGMGRDLWRLLTADYATVFWRARVTNPVCAWYAGQCDGLARFPEWNVYWKGLAPEKIAAAIAYSLAAPVDILSAGPTVPTTLEE